MIYFLQMFIQTKFQTTLIVILVYPRWIYIVLWYFVRSLIYGYVMKAQKLNLELFARFVKSTLFKGKSLKCFIVWNKPHCCPAIWRKWILFVDFCKMCTLKIKCDGKFDFMERISIVIDFDQSSLFFYIYQLIVDVP